MLVNCVAYQDGKKLASIQPPEIHEYLRKTGCVVWVALFEPSPEEMAQMQEEFDLHPLAIEDATRGHQRPKIEEYGDSLLVVLHMLDDRGEGLQVGEVVVFAGSNYVVSVRHRTEQGFTGVRARCEREPDLLGFGSAYILYAIMDSVVDRYFPILDAAESRLEEIEAQIFTTKDSRATLEALYALKQRIVTLKHATAPLLEAVGRLHGGRVPPLVARVPEYFRDVYDHLLRINQGVDGLRESVTTMMSVNLSLLTIHESEVTKRLAGYAALVAVPTLVAGVYGMNFTHMPEIDWPWGYPLAMALMVGIDLYLFRRFRKAGWL
jgi:magnesium transporter